MKKIIAAVTLASIVSTASAQRHSTYRTALGVKVWDGAGISFKHFLQDRKALELIGYFWNQGSRITGLYEIHGPVTGAKGLQWYIGPGAHAGFYNSRYGDGAFIGIDGVLGLDYTFSGVPLNLSLDWQPSFEFGSNRGFVGSWGGLGVRYTF